MFIDDGEGYLDLGRDNTFTFNKNNELVLDSDGTWLSLNDHVVAYYMLSDEYIDDDNYKTIGMIKAYLNNEKVEIIVSFNNKEPYGEVLGARKVYDDIDTLQKGLIKIKTGDELKFIADYYTYDGKFIAEYQIGDTLIVDGELELNNIYLNNDYIYAYCFEDIYGNNIYSPKKEAK